jgi:CBS domain-containing protein
MKWNSAKDLMTTGVETIEADWPVDRAAEFLIDRDISGAPVVREGEIAGVISLTDIARYSSTAGEPASKRPTSFYRSKLESTYAEEELNNLRVNEGGDTTAEHVMTPQIYDVNEHTSVQQVAQVMHRSGIHRVFVTRNGEIRGVITALDMLQVVAAL